MWAARRRVDDWRGQPARSCVSRWIARVFDGDLKTVSLNISNQNKQLPYLEGWIEDDRGNKIQSPFTVLPPVQRVEPGKPSQVKIQSLPAARRCRRTERRCAFNLREIPPRSNKPNAADSAARASNVYRPAALAEKNAAPWQEQLTRR